MVSGFLSQIVELITSATLWTALGAVGTVAGLFFIHRQIQHARNVAAYEFLRREDDRFRTDDMRRRRSELAVALLLHPDDYSQIDAVADFVLDYFEDLGVILRKGLAPVYFMWSMNCYYILRYRYALLPYITWVRREWEDKKYYADFEYLFQQVAKIEKQQTGQKKIAYTDAEIRDFLKEEVCVTIRLPTVADLEAVMRIEKTAFLTDDYPKSQLRELLGENPRTFFAALLLNEIVGYAVGYLSGESGESAEFDSMAVDPRYWRLGIGRIFADRLLQRLAELGATTCALEVRPSNLAAIRMYEGFGFQVVGKKSDYYSNGGDALLMKATLAPYRFPGQLSPSKVESRATPPKASDAQGCDARP